jgi:hypothetical protein
MDPLHEFSPLKRENKNLVCLPLQYNTMPSKESFVVAHHPFLLCFLPRPSRDLLFLTHVVHM